MEGSAITAITNWYRDKGYCMGQKVGYIPAMIGGKAVHVSPVGKVAMPTELNISRWKGWWKLLNIDQWGVFYFGAMAGMFLPGILYVAVLPRGQALPAWGIAASSASGLILKMGNFGWFLALFFGFWILYSTAISNVDLVVRQSTDMLWFCIGKDSENSQRWIYRRIYYPLLLILTVWAVAYMNTSAPLIILAISANIANFTMALSAVATIRLNRKFLPKEFRPALWREAILILNFIFFGFFFSVFFTVKILGIKF